MLPWLQAALIGLSLLIGVVALVYVAVNRVIDRWLLMMVAALSLGTLVQLFTGVAQLISVDREVAGAAFVGYLVGLVLVPPVAAFWALGERSRSGTVVLVILGVLVPVLLLRLDQIWSASLG